MSTRTSTPFPYATLFRSDARAGGAVDGVADQGTEDAGADRDTDRDHQHGLEPLGEEEADGAWRDQHGDDEDDADRLQRGDDGDREHGEEPIIDRKSTRLNSSH